MSTNAKIADESYKRNRREHIDGYEYIESKSNDQLAVYRKGNDYILSSRGTSFDKDRAPDDIVADLAVLRNTSNHSKIIQDRVKGIKSVIKQIKIENPNSNIELTGHSLGGSVSIQALNDPFINDNVDKVITYNPGTSPMGTKFTGDASKIENHIVEGDPIAQFKVPGKIIKYKSIDQDISIPELGLSLFDSGFTQNQLKNLATKHSINVFTNPGKVEITDPTGKTTTQVRKEVKEGELAVKSAIKTVSTIGKGLRKFKKVAKIGETVVKGAEVAEGAVNPIFDAILLIDWGVNKLKREENARKILESLGQRANLEEHNSQPFLNRSVRVELFGEFLSEAKRSFEDEDPNSQEYKQAKFLLQHPAVFWAFTRDFADKSSVGSRAEIIGLEIGSGLRWNQFLKENTLEDLEATQPKIITQKELDAQIENLKQQDNQKIIDNNVTREKDRIDRIDYQGHRNVFNLQSEVDQEWNKGHPDYEYSKNVLGLGVDVAREKADRYEEFYKRGIIRRPGT